MSSNSMYGVVLWTDTADSRAIIWCEDHGDLAFYTSNGVSAHDGLSLDAGDLVQFDVTQENNLRLARNPQLVAQSHSQGLIQKLSRGRTAPQAAGGANVVSLDRFRRGGDGLSLRCRG
ncbi:hypothetical protein DU478_08885 [Thalassococcus profundi]|uniref:Cold shock domain-containing protein n=1 Tax=Thalassococcus profundi TaxID=2282382 RepID=A0A369TNX2_9RHOB|nr:hypothetical protein [Thalassococcus profundi]RDD66552.1 hypothetical protein DU478_08885 [Thalassococcus profundi]